MGGERVSCRPDGRGCDNPGPGAGRIVSVERVAEVEVAGLAGVARPTFRAYVSCGQATAPVGGISFRPTQCDSMCQQRIIQR